MSAGMNTMCKCNWPRCAKACDCRCHILAEAHAAHSFQVGQSSGLAIAAAAILQDAVEAFSRGKDEEARSLRALSEKLKVKANAMHPGPDVTYPEEG